MKYQCITITPNPEPREPVFRQFAVPVRQVEGMWVPAGRWQEETHLYDAMDMATDRGEASPGEVLPAP